MFPLSKNLIEMNYTDISEVLNVYYNEFIENKPKRLMIFNEYRKEYCQDQLTNTRQPINLTTDPCVISNNFTKNTTSVTTPTINLLLNFSTNYIKPTSYNFLTFTSKHMQKTDSNSVINLGISIAIVSGVVITVGIMYIIFRYYKKRRYTAKFSDTETQQSQNEVYQLSIPITITGSES